MADVAAGLLQARRCIHGVAEERDFHLDGAEFANDHGPAMKRGAEVCPEAEVANVGVGAFVQLLQRVEAGADAVPVPPAASGQVAMISSPTYLWITPRCATIDPVTSLTKRFRKSRKPVSPLGDDGRRFHIDEQQHALLDARPAIAAGDEIKQYALA
jgi:hypothetical protein